MILQARLPHSVPGVARLLPLVVLPDRARGWPLISLAGLCLLLAVFVSPGPLCADTGTSLGDRSGEGTTAFTGLAQAPEANLFTGALGTSIPIPVPPGRKNMTPQLSLQYSSSGGPSPYGRGWSLPIGQITRTTKWGVPHVDNPHFDEFVLMLPGAPAADLVETQTSGVFRPRVEMSWVEATFDGVKWEVIDRAGMRYTFGDTSNARLEAFDQGVYQFTSAWALTTIRDPYGNRVDITWRDPASNGNHFLPDKVEYGAKSASSHPFAVRFYWVDHPQWCTGCGEEGTNGQSPCACQSYHPDGVRSYRLGVEQTLRYYLDYVAITAPSGWRILNLEYVDRGTGHLALVGALTPDQPEQLFVYADWDEGEHEVSSPSIASHGNDKMRRWNSSQDVDRTMMDMNGDAVLDLVNGNSFPWSVNFGEVSVDEVTGDVSYGLSSTVTSWSGPGTINTRIRTVHTQNHCAGHHACTVIDTFDITGDGIPDLVDAQADNWKVYPGEFSNSGWRFGTAIPWASPSKRIRTTWGPEARYTNRDTIDMTGDGLPDLVLTDQVAGAWKVYRNTGRGFDLNNVVLFSVPFDDMDKLNDTNLGNTITMVTDFNGDGLPDLLTSIDYENLPLEWEWQPDPDGDFEVLRTNFIFVYFNTGQGFADTAVALETPYFCGLPHSFITDEVSRTNCDLLDISGDGLPDLVQRYTSTEWRVLLNVGGYFEPVEFEPPPAISRHSRPPRIWPGLSGFIRHAVGSGQLVDMIDVNGDGLLDRVTSDDTTSWTVQLHAATTKPSLMTMMENGLGGTNTIKYEPSTHFDHLDSNGNPTLPNLNWVATGTRLNDGQCVLLPGRDPFDVDPSSPSYNNCIASGSEVINRIDYEDGLFAYETDTNGELISREFRGYGMVAQRDIFGNDTVTDFHQGYNDKGLVDWITHYVGSVDDPAATILRYEDNTWLQFAQNGRTRISLFQNSRTHSDGSSLPRSYQALNGPTDQFGNVTSSCRSGTGTYPICVRTEYAAPGLPHSPRDRPSTIQSWEDRNYNGVPDSTELLEEKHFYYDGQSTPGSLTVGNATRIDSRLINDTEDRWLSTLHEYDTYGNMTKMTDPEMRVTLSEFNTDGAGLFLYPTRVTEAHGSLNLVTETEYDYFLGKPTIKRGPNELVNGTEYRTVYDSVGRVMEEYRPGDVYDPDPDDSNPSVVYEYEFPSEPASGPWPLAKAKVTQRQAGQQRWVESYVDALGRGRYAVSPRVIGGTLTDVKSEHVVFDAGGNVIRRYDPYPAGNAPGGYAAYDYNLNGVAGWTDPFGRVRTTTAPDGTQTSVISYQGIATFSVDAGGLLTISHADGLGREVRTETYAANLTLYSASESVYDGSDRLTELYQNCSGSSMTCGAGDVPVKQMVYDTLGRKIRTVDRDSGTWEYGYDDVGNLIWQEDPKEDQHLQFCYDDLNRPTHKCPLGSEYVGAYHACSPIPCGDTDAFYEYDDPGVTNSLGRVTRVTDGAGEMRVLGYDALGRQTGATRVIDVEGEVGEATLLYEYNDLDQVIETTYPDGEVVQMTYDASGQPETLCNTDGYFYVYSAHYDIFGRLTSIAKGNELEDRAVFYGASENYRLDTIGLGHRAGGFPDHAQKYYYNTRGQIKEIQQLFSGGHNGALNGGDYTYDHFGRLTGFTADAPGVAARSYGYDAWGNITNKAGISMVYDASGAPHQMEELDGTVLWAGSYDANGNRTVRTLGGQWEHGYTFDLEDRLSEILILPNGGSGRRVAMHYDEGGQQKARVVKSWAGVTERVTKYYAPVIEVSSDGSVDTTVKSYFFGGQRVASRIDDGAAWQFSPLASISLPNPVQLASQWMGDSPVLVVKLTGGASAVTAAAIALLFVTLFVMPPGRRRRAVVGIRLTRGAALGLTILFVVGTIPLPVLIQPA